MQKILVIDDEPPIQKVLTDRLRLEGYDPISALDGKEGLQKVEDERPDLILLDIVMPILDGISVLKKLKEKVYTNKIPVIILTNLGDKETIATALESGGTDYLVKASFTLDELMTTVKEKLASSNR